ncbi:site-specific integrase [Actinoplanes sp. NPDC051475]|uniref:tyrosine-type recombinase/integrase n=1 Tax=Actinoplanes sp. NPDC051475 TaxID=3157225 RepID=UPI00344C65D2
MASMKRRNASFCLRWRYAGRLQCCTFRGPTPAKALAAKKYIEAQAHQVASAAVYAAIDPGSPKAPRRPQTPLLRDWIKRWLTVKIDVSPTTHAEYARLLHHRVVRDLGDLRIGDVSRHEHLDPWKAALAKDLMPAGVRKHWAVLSEVMRDAVPQWRPDNPLRRPYGHRGNGLPRPGPSRVCLLTGDQARALVACCGEPLRDLVMVALGTGMRLGELLGLRVVDVRFDAAQPLVRVEQVLRRGGDFGGPKTARSQRTITLAASTAEVVAARIGGRASGGLVFTAPGGGPWEVNNLRQRYWRPAVIAAQQCLADPSAASGPGWVGSAAARGWARLHGRPRFQDLRHSHVAELIAAGWDLYAIQLRLGHASIRTTLDTYGHLLADGDHDRLAGLDRRLRDAFAEL